MAKILNQEDTRELFIRLYDFPSLYNDLTDYQRDEVYQYAQRKLTERVVYWSGAIDSPVNIETAAKAGENVLEYFLSRDDASRRARSVISLLENENQKKIVTEKLTKKKRQNNLKEVRRMYVFYLGLLHIRGKFYLDHINQEQLDEQINEKLIEVTTEKVSAQKVRRLLVGQGEDEEEEIIFVVHNKQSKRWEFKKDKFELKSKKYREAYDAAATLIKRNS